MHCGAIAGLDLIVQQALREDQYVHQGPRYRNAKIADVGRVHRFYLLVDLLLKPRPIASAMDCPADNEYLKCFVIDA
jgi:hypothetical protein